MNNTSTEATHHAAKRPQQEKIIRQGYGTNFYDNGQIEYEGDWRNNVPEGKGVYFNEMNDPLFLGIWKGGKPHTGNDFGYTYDKVPTEPSYDHYEGCIRNGVPHGFGTMYTRNNVKRYEGMWENNKRHGKGTLYNGKGRPLFTCEWKDDKPCIDTPNPDNTLIPLPGNPRRVVFNLLCGRTLKGRHYTGKVIKYHPSGCKSYEGDLDYAKRHGTGTSFNEKGIRLYTGEWKNDKRHGQGTSFKPDGTVDFKGTWKNNKPVHPTE